MIFKPIQREISCRKQDHDYLKPGKANWLSFYVHNTIYIYKKNSEFSHIPALLLGFCKKLDWSPLYIYLHNLCLFLDNGLSEGKIHMINLHRTLLPAQGIKPEKLFDTLNVERVEEMFLN